MGSSPVLLAGSFFRPCAVARYCRTKRRLRKSLRLVTHASQRLLTVTNLRTPVTPVHNPHTRRNGGVSTLPEEDYHEDCSHIYSRSVGARRGRPARLDRLCDSRRFVDGRG